MIGGIMEEELLYKLRKAVIYISEVARSIEEEEQKRKDNFTIIKFDKDKNKKD